MRCILWISTTFTESVFFMMTCLFFSFYWGWLHGDPLFASSVDLPVVCLPNCVCGRFTADCLLTFCEEEYETQTELLILRGGMCKEQWDRLHLLSEDMHIELHNAQCPPDLPHCE